MDYQEIQAALEMEAETITQKAVTIPFISRDKSMIPKGVKVDTITISPMLVGTLFRLKPYLARIDKSDMEKMAVKKGRDYDVETPELMAKYSDIVLDILVIAINNSKNDPPPWYKDFLKENCQWDDLHVLLNAVLYRLGTQSFYKSTIAVSSMGPVGEREIIAFQKNLKSWTTQSVQFT